MIRNQTGEFLFGDNDALPMRLSEHFDETFKSFFLVDLAYINARPTHSHALIKLLRESGSIGTVFTDNVDDLLERSGISVTETRLQGIVNEHVDVTTGKDRSALSKDTRGLMVVGISADRRDVIKQARALGKRIVVVNPLHPVSPYSKNVDYLQEGDVFLQMEFKQLNSELRRLLGPVEDSVALSTRTIAPSPKGPKPPEADGDAIATARTPLSILEQLTHLSLREVAVVGNYCRFEEPVRNALTDWYHRISEALVQTQTPRADENFLVAAAPGSGKTHKVALSSS